MESDIQRDIVGAIESIGRMGEAQSRLNEAVTAELDRVWKDNAELRDELHAVANRVENLTRALTTEPAEVAARIVTDANRGLLGG